MQIDVKSWHDGSTVRSIELSEEVFAGEINHGIVHQALVSYQAAARAGTKAQKSRAGVSGGGRKPWRQKGSGRARAGTIRGPIWRGGGVTFAAKPRDYTKKINTKMYRAALRSILTSLHAEQRIIVLEHLDLEGVSTKTFVQSLHRFNQGSAYIVAEDMVPKNFELSARNIPRVITSTYARLHLGALVHSDKIFMTEQAMIKLQKVLSQ